MICLIVSYYNREPAPDVLISVPRPLGPPPTYRAPLEPHEFDSSRHEPDHYEIKYRDSSYTFGEHIRKVAELWGDAYYISPDQKYIRLSEDVVRIDLVWDLCDEPFYGYVFSCTPYILDKLRSDETVGAVRRGLIGGLPSVVEPDTIRLLAC